MPLLRPSEGNLGQCFGMFGPSRVILGSARARTFLSHERVCTSSSMKGNTLLKTLHVCTCVHVSVARARLCKQQHQEEHFAQNSACAHVRGCLRCARVCAKCRKTLRVRTCARISRASKLFRRPRLLAAFSPASRRLLAALTPLGAK